MHPITIRVRFVYHEHHKTRAKNSLRMSQVCVSSAISVRNILRCATIFWNSPTTIYIYTHGQAPVSKAGRAYLQLVRVNILKRGPRPTLLAVSEFRQIYDGLYL
jgi:hypothetical protein